MSDPTKANLEIVEQIDSGLYGRVFRGFQPHLSRSVAVKVIKDEFAGKADAVSHARALARVGVHPNIVTVFGVEEVLIHGIATTAIVMEWLEGETFASRLAGPRFNESELQTICTGVLDGIEHMHLQGMQHGDLHFGNVIVVHRSHPKIIDIDATRDRSLGRLSQVSREGAIAADVDYCRQLIHRAFAHSSHGPSIVNQLDADLTCVTTLVEIRSTIKQALDSAKTRGIPSDGSDSSDSPTASKSARQAERFREWAVSGRGNGLSGVFRDFADEFITELSQIRMTRTRNQAATWCDSVLANIDSAVGYRNSYVDVVTTAARYVQDSWFAPAMCQLLERLLPFGFRPAGGGAFFDSSEDNYRFLLHELFLYSIAALIQERRYDVASDLIRHPYVCPERFGGGDHLSLDFSAFQQRASTLENEYNSTQPDRQLSVTMKLIMQRATREDVVSMQLVQADAICGLASITADGQRFSWTPFALLYGRSFGKLELFVRAETPNGMHTLSALLGLRDARHLLSLLRAPALMTVGHFAYAYVPELLNIKSLERVWGS